MNDLAWTLKSATPSGRGKAGFRRSAVPWLIKNDQQFLEIMWELFPGFRKVPKEENPIMIGENDSDEILTMVIPELTRVMPDPTKLPIGERKFRLLRREEQAN